VIKYPGYKASNPNQARIVIRDNCKESYWCSHSLNPRCGSCPYILRDGTPEEQKLATQCAAECEVAYPKAGGGYQLYDIWLKKWRPGTI